MKIIVVYESKTGFTAKYAQWIAEALGCQSKPLKEMSKDQIASYDIVVFGGWIMGNMISGIKKFRALSPKAGVLFAVGSTPAYYEVIGGIKKQNQIGDDKPFFYMEGGFHFDKLGFAQRTLLKTLKKSVSKKEDPNRQEKFMAQALGTSFDHSEQEMILPLVEYVKGMEKN